MWFLHFCKQRTLRTDRDARKYQSFLVSNFTTINSHRTISLRRKRYCLELVVFSILLLLLLRLKFGRNDRFVFRLPNLANNQNRLRTLRSLPLNKNTLTQKGSQHLKRNVAACIGISSRKIVMQWKRSAECKNYITLSNTDKFGVRAIGPRL